MAKTAPAKKKGQSIHSRAAKRASSPSISTDKSLKNVKPPPESLNHRPSILAIHQGAGVTKKSKQGRKVVLSAKARRRQEKGLDRAEAVMDKSEVKVQKSLGRARTVHERRKAWEELNRKLSSKKTGTTDEEGLEGEGNWVDEGAENYDGLDHTVMDRVDKLQVTDSTMIGSIMLTTDGILVEEDEIL